MNTRKEILNLIVVDGTGIEVTQDEALKAMSEYAKQTAKLFLVWCQLKGYRANGYDEGQLETMYNIFHREQEKQ